MDNWQFLIQKQGDRGWNTLDSSHLQILPGKYRLLARSWLVNTDVEVRVTHTAAGEVPPKRRVLKRSRRTNADGLMAVIPFTQFKPGIWELRCSGDVMSAMLGQSWQYTLYIEVLSPVLPELPSDPDPENQDQRALIENEVNIVISPLVNPMWLRGQTTEQILQNLLDIALPVEDPQVTEEVINDVLTLPDPLLVNITLDQETYVAKWGSSLTINGYVEINDLENLADEKLQIKKLSDLQLEISLITPANSQVINHIEQSLSNKILPFSFTSSIDISPNCESKLLLADVQLYGIYGEVDQVKLLGSHSFIITADITELLAVQNQGCLADNSQDNSETLVEKRVLGLELFNVAKFPSLAQFHILKPAVKKVLPPQIKPEGMGEVVVPKLPSLPQGLSSPEVNENSLKLNSPPPPINLIKLQIKPVKTSFPYLVKIKQNQDQFRKNGPVLPVTISRKQDAPALLPELLLESYEVVNEHLQEAISNIDNFPGVNDPSLSSVNIAESQNTPQLLADDDIMDQYLQETITNINDHSIADNLRENVQENLKGEINIITSEMPNLVELNLDESVNLEEEVNEVNVEEITENKLSYSLLEQWRERQDNSLNQNINVPEIYENYPEDNDVLNINQNTPITEIEAVIEISLPTQEITPAVKPSWLSQEVVIDDVFIENDFVRKVVEEKEDRLEVEENVDIVDLRIMQSLPTPQLYLSEGELIAGKSMIVRFELPIVLSNVIVKLWIEDYQTRTLLDDIHIVTDIHCTSWGTMEGVANLIVPYGCLEMIIGAIAYHQVTHQESNKVTILKKIIPADLPKMDFDELLGF